MDFGFPSFEKIKLSEKDGTLTITIANPPVNALSMKVRNELIGALAIGRMTSEIKDITITGEGNFFSAGADIKKDLAPIILSGNKQHEAYEFSRQGQSLIRYIKDIKKPVTASIDGYAFGGGFELALACRKIIATPRSIIGLPELTLGVMPGWGGMLTLPRKCHDAKTGLGFIIRALYLHAHIAHMHGLIDTLDIKDEDKHKQMDGLWTLAKPPKKPASPLTQILIRGFAGRNLVEGDITDELYAMEAMYFDFACTQEDAREGVSAFLEKREAKFNTIKFNPFA